jgi:tetratricopeptide (TPR) repeat protein
MIRVDLAKVLAEAGQPAAARGEYEAALRIDAEYVPALAGLGALQAAQGEHQAAQGALRRALELDPRADDARFNLARVLELGGDPAGARVEYERLAGAPETRPALRTAARERLSRLPASAPARP